MNPDSERVASLFQQLRVSLYKATPETQGKVQRAVEELCEIFSGASPELRAEIVSYVRPKSSHKLFWFAELMSWVAVRKSSPEAVRMGLTALILENNTFDFRDMLMRVVLIYHSAVKLDLDPLQLFDSAASLAVNEQLAEIVRDFPRRSPQDRSLATFRYEESGQGESFRYRRVDPTSMS
jgi:hypothetical protein